ncbi:MAG: PPC domain-containing protein [Anaerolineae bacterium]|nr:PPC domain-containing protein [Anaerolineae bacterium]
MSWIGKASIALAALAVVIAAGVCCCCPSSGNGPQPQVTAAPPMPSPTPPWPTPTPFTSPAGPFDRGEIAVGDTRLAQLPSAVSADFWTLDIVAGMAVTIDVVAEDRGWDPMLTVRDAAGEEIAFDDDGGEGLNPRLTGLFLGAGSYELWIEAYDGYGEYTLSVVEVTETSGGGWISYGETVFGEITDWQPEQWWEFEGRAEEVISISMIGRGDLIDTYLELYGPDGSFLTSDDDGGDGLFSLIDGYMLPETGHYRIVTRAYGSDVGEYELTLEQVEIELQTIAYDQTVRDELERAGARDYWVFAGEEGDIVRISMVGLGDFLDTYLELYGPDGSLLIADDDGGGDLSALILDFSLPQSGDYRIVARAYGSYSGEYELTLRRTKERTIAYGQTTTGEIVGIGRGEGWLFEGAAGDLVSISMVGLGDFQNTYLELYDPDGSLLAADDDSGKDRFAYIGGYRLPYSGTYHILADISLSGYEVPYGEFPMGEGGVLPAAYRLTLRQIEPQTIAYGQTLAGQLTEEEQWGHWFFQGVMGEIVRISAVGTGGLSDTYLELRAPGGALLVEDDDAGEGYAALVDGYTLPEAGTYHVVVRAYGGGAGAYQLALQRVTVQEQPLAYGEVAAGELAVAGERDYWRFEGAAGDEVTISLVGAGDLTDTYLELYGPDGALLAEDDDGGENAFARIAAFELPANGAYRIVVRAFGAEVGEYELTLEGP